MRYLVFIVLFVLLLLVLRRSGRQPNGVPLPGNERNKGPAPVVGGVFRPASADDLLGGEPLLAEMKDFRLEISLFIDPTREGAIRKLRRCGAIDESQLRNDCPVVKFCSVPLPLLHRLFPQWAESEALSVGLYDAASGLCSRYCHGRWPDIEAELWQVIASPAGTREVAQERGDLADGVYFLEETFVHLNRRHGPA